MTDSLSCISSSDASPHTSHLLAQINFLHKEVDRLEEQLQSTRTKSLTTTRNATENYEKLLKEKTLKVEEWRNKYTVLEKTLMTHELEKSEWERERKSLFAQIKSFESSFSQQQEDLCELRARCEAAENLIAESDISKGGSSISMNGRYAIDAVTSAHRATLDKYSQVDFPLCERCNMNSHCDLATLVGEGHQNQLRHSHDNLKTIETMYETTLKLLEETKMRLSLEIERNAAVHAEFDELSGRFGVLQSKLNEEAAAKQNVIEKLSKHEREKQKFLSDIAQIEREKHFLEEQLRQYEKDIMQLITFKNISSEQLSQISTENDQLRRDLQEMQRKESRFLFAVKAKEEECDDALDAYRSATKENDLILENSKTLQRELHNLRTALASKEECILFLRDQTQSLNQREQELILDVQSFEYDNDQLQRRLQKDEVYISELEEKNNELKHLLESKNISIEELHQNLAELSKQLVASENEANALRRRCDSIQVECTSVQAAFEQELKKRRGLEEANGRLLTKSIINMTSDEELRHNRLENSRLNHDIDAKEEALRKLEEELSTERTLRKKVEDYLAELQFQMQATRERADRLEKVVEEQTNALSVIAT